MGRLNKFSNTAMLANQKRKMHQSQEKAGMHEKPKPFKFTPAGYDTSSFWFWFFFVNMLCSGLGAAMPKKTSDTQAKDDEIFAKVMGRMKFDLTCMSQADLRSGGVCHEMANRMAMLAATNDAFRENAEAVLSQEDFKIVCTNQKTINEHYGPVNGFFQPLQNKMVLPADDYHDMVIGHETIHAREHSAHKPDGNCHTPHDSTGFASLAPIFPFNDQNIKLFEKYADLGDAFINTLFMLSNKEKSGLRLSKEEQYQLIRARTELANTTPIQLTTIKNHKALDVLKRSGWPQKKDVKIKVAGEFVALVKKVTVKDQDVLIEYRIDDPIDILNYNLRKFQELKSTSGRFPSKQEELAERLAYSHQALTRQGRQFIYPELAKFLAEQKELCRPKKSSMVRSEL